MVCGEPACAEKGVSVHIIPYFGDERPVAVSRRKRWTDFVEETRKNWQATKTSGVCSEHFSPDDYEQSLGSASLLPGFQSSFLKTLRRDEHGTSSFPTIRPPKKIKALKVASSSARPRPSDHSHRQVKICVLSTRAEFQPGSVNRCLQEGGRVEIQHHVNKGSTHVGNSQVGIRENKRFFCSVG